jgi:hypothetical protein
MGKGKNPKTKVSSRRSTHITPQPSTSLFEHQVFSEEPAHLPLNPFGHAINVIEDVF